MRVVSTRLRFIKSKEINLLTSFIDRLSFKVEIKSIAHDGKKWACFFIIPDEIQAFNSFDLDEVTE